LLRLTIQNKPEITMKITLLNLVALLGGANMAYGFVNSNSNYNNNNNNNNNPMAVRSRATQGLHMSDNKFNADAYAKSMSAAAIEQMKNLKPGDIDRMIEELDNMNPIQKTALKAMNMDVRFSRLCFAFHCV
jgi:hypothetical protein